MKIHKTHTKGIILSVLIGAAALITITPALSYWVVSNQNAYSTKDTLSNSDFQSTEYCTVDVYRAVTSGGEVSQGSAESKPVDSSTDWNTFLGYISAYNIVIPTANSSTDSYGYYEEINGTATGLGGSEYYNYFYYFTGIYYSALQYAGGTYQCVLEITTNVTYTFHHRTVWSDEDTYAGAYSITISSITGDSSTSIETDSFGSIEVENGGIITSKMFANFFESMQEDYYFSSLIYQENKTANSNAPKQYSESSPSFDTPFYLNESIVESDLNLYVLFYESMPSSMGISTLTDEINLNTGTLTVSSADDNSTLYNITEDSTYNSTSNSVNVGYYDRATTVASGTTVNLCLTDGNVMDIIEYTSTSGNRSQYINENHSDKTCDYTVKLAGDLEIYGQLTVGAEIGSGTNQGVQSNIHTNYVKLDLCGHTINIHNGGSLIGYGVITDSVGNGEIHVYGGAYIESTIVIYDYKGGSSTVGAFAVDVFPFSNYNLPYLQVPTYLEYDTNGWGMLKAYYCINPFASVVTEIHNDLNLIGTGNDCLFVLDSGTPNSSFVLLSLTENPNVSSNNISTYTASQALERHFNFYFNNVDVTLEYFTLDFNISGIVDISMKTNQFDFPISSFFSVYMYNSNFTVSSRIVFQKGSSLYMDEDSDLIFSYQTIDRTYVNSLAAHEESVTIAGSIFFMDVHVDSYVNNSGTESMYTSDRHNYQNLSTVETYLNSNLAFWKYSVSAYRIAGTIYFTNGNAESYPYSIAGYCDVNSVGIVDNNGQVLTGSTYNFHTSDTTSYNAFNNLILYINENSSSVSVYFKTYDFDGINGTYDCDTLAYSADNTCEFNALVRGRALPLISNGVAYSYSNVFNDINNDRYSPNIVGTYNQDLNLIDSNGQFYYYNSSDVDEKPYTGTGSTSSTLFGFGSNERNREYNHTTRLKQCSYDSTNHYITDTDNSSNAYVFFSSCYLPYDTSGNTVNLQRLLASTSISSVSSFDLAVTYNTTYSRWIISS